MLYVSATLESVSTASCQLHFIYAYKTYYIVVIIKRKRCDWRWFGLTQTQSLLHTLTLKTNIFRPFIFQSTFVVYRHFYCVLSLSPCYHFFSSSCLKWIEIYMFMSPAYWDSHTHTHIYRQRYARQREKAREKNLSNKLCAPHIQYII